ncbi:MAG: hypothetical protein GX927_00050 [Lentisphaerae bacterium]|jgi:tRNA A-37 threonylcarbamoyl transferase component Bud32|nr:hypothetical protein [Lentisphaerota bacterium]
MCKLEIQPEWQAKFQKQGLDSIDAVLKLKPEAIEECCLPCGVEAFLLEDDDHLLCLKRQQKIPRSQMFKDICKCNFPLTLTSRERKAIAMLKNAGFIVPQIVAWGEKRCFGLPQAGVLFLQPPEGQTLPAFLASELDGVARRQGVEKAETTLMAMHSMGFTWPDCRIENFLLLPDGEVGLINLGSIKRHKTLSQEERQQQFEIFYASLVG